LAVSSLDRAIRTLDESGRITQTVGFADKNKQIKSICWSTDSKILIAQTFSDLHRWEAETGKALPPVKVGGILSPDRRLIVDVSRRPLLYLSNLSDGKLTHTVPAMTLSSEVSWSGDSKFLAITYFDKYQLFDLGSDTMIETHDMQSPKVIWSTVDSTYVVTSIDRESITLWKPGGQVVGVLEDSKGWEPMAWSADGKLLLGRNDRVAAGNAAQKLSPWRIWHVSSGEILCDVRQESIPAFQSLAWSPDNRHLATRTGMLEGILRVFDVVAEQMQSLIMIRNTRSGPGGQDETQVILFSSDGHYRMLAGREANDLVYVVQTQEGQLNLTPAEFAQRYGWKNDPNRVRLCAD
jgi:hypothetical protein